MEKNTPGITVYVTAFVIVVIWGCTFVQTKLLINAGLRPDEIFLFRFVLAYLLILPFAGKRLWLSNRRDELMAVALGLTGGSAGHDLNSVRGLSCQGLQVVLQDAGVDCLG